MIGVVTVEEFPHGLNCAVCHVEMPPGTPYTDTPDGFIGDTPVALLTCVEHEGMNTDD